MELEHQYEVLTEHSYHGGAVYDWSKEGIPSPKLSKTMMKEQVQQLYHAAIARPYMGQWNPDTQTYFCEADYRHLTKMEVIIERIVDRATTGELKAVDMLMDRVLGKPKQSVEAVTMSLSYTEYLDRLAKEEQEEQNQQNQIINLLPDTNTHWRSTLPPTIDDDDLAGL